MFLYITEYIPRVSNDPYHLEFFLEGGGTIGINEAGLSLIGSLSPWFYSELGSSRFLRRFWSHQTRSLLYT